VYEVVFLIAITPILLYRWYRGYLTAETTGWGGPRCEPPPASLGAAFPRSIGQLYRLAPLRPLLFMALFDQAANLLSAWPQVPLGGTATNTLSQLVLPVNMALAWRFLGTRFTVTHYAGAGLAVGAGLVQVLLADPDAGAAHGGEYMLFLFIMLLSTLPTAGGNVYKERCLKDAETLDLWYVNAVVAVFQMVMGLMSTPLIALPFTQGHEPLSLVPQYYANATRCTFGSAGGVPADSACETDVASPAVLFCIYIVFNLTFSNLMLLLFRRGSSTLFSISATARIPVVAIMLLIPVLAGPKASKPSVADGAATALAVAGLALYQWRPEQKVSKDSAEEAAGMLGEGLEDEGGLAMPLLGGRSSSGGGEERTDR